MSISSSKTTFKELKLMFFFKLQELLAVVVVECVIFTNSLIGITIQDGGKRERSNVTYLFINQKINKN